MVSVQLADFFDAVAHDPRMGANHIVVYLALLHVWQLQGCPAEIHVATYEMMQVTKIKAIDTYLKHVRALSNFGYIRYQPALNDQVKAIIQFKKL